MVLLADFLTVVGVMASCRVTWQVARVTLNVLANCQADSRLKAASWGLSFYKKEQEY